MGLFKLKERVDLKLTETSKTADRNIGVCRGCSISQDLMTRLFKKVLTADSRS